MRLRRTALPSAFLMLQPNRLRLRPLGRRKAVNSRLVRFRPSRYTASYSTRRSKRQSRGKPSCGPSDARETVASFFAALRKDLPSTLALHSCAEAVFLVTAAHMGLKRTFRQRSLSSNELIRAAPLAISPSACSSMGANEVSGRREHLNLGHPAHIADLSELPSVSDRSSTVKEGAETAAS